MKVDLLIKNASELLTCKSKQPKIKEELNNLSIIKDGAVGIKEGKIVFVGKTIEVDFESEKIIDAEGKVVMPGFIDCHTHSVFAGSRENEFVKKLHGKKYLEILKEGGGILSTVEKTRNASKEELFQKTMKKASKMMSYGTATIEIKSGYGLNFDEEKKILEVAEMVNQKHPIDVVKTYLGAHTIPKDKTKQEYILEVLDSLEKMKNHAEFCDIFCEKGVFTIEEARLILEKAKKLGYELKIHSEQLNTLHSAELAAELKAISADHLDNISDVGIEKMAESGTIGVLLPGVVFYLGTERYAPARKMINKGMALALSTDYNPGSCPCENMQFMLTLACLKMKMFPAEAINSATINAAFAINRDKEIGSLEVGKKADIIILNAKNYNYLPYHFGVNHVETVVKNGKII